MTTHDVSIQVRSYLAVFGALLVLTAATVGASYLQLPAGAAITLGLIIATAKAALVALFFMHLNHERQLIYISLGLTGVLFAVLILVTLWTEADHVPGTRFMSLFGNS